jgi:hypothetical protein
VGARCSRVLCAATLAGVACTVDFDNDGPEIGLDDGWQTETFESGAAQDLYAAALPEDADIIAIAPGPHDSRIAVLAEIRVVQIDPGPTITHSRQIFVFDTSDEHIAQTTLPPGGRRNS